MSYWRRTEAPKAFDANFTGIAYKGLSQCVTDLEHPAWTGSTLWNCVGYVWGRWSEMGYGTEATERGLTNSASWIIRNKKAFLSSDPSVGAVALFDVGTFSKYYSHVAIVESFDDNYIYVTESDYYSFLWREQTYSRSMPSCYMPLPGYPSTPVTPPPGEATGQPISASYGPGNMIYLTSVQFSCHYVDGENPSSYDPDTGEPQYDTYMHPALALYINNEQVATSTAGPASGGYTDISWSCGEPGLLTNNFQIRLLGSYPGARRFDIIFSAIEYYLYSGEDDAYITDGSSVISKHKYISYFDGEKWTEFKKE